MGRHGFTPDYRMFFAHRFVYVYVLVLFLSDFSYWLDADAAWPTKLASSPVNFLTHVIHFFIWFDCITSVERVGVTYIKQYEISSRFRVQLSPNSTCCVTSRHVTTLHARLVVRAVTWRVVRVAKMRRLDSVSCRDALSGIRALLRTTTRCATSTASYSATA